MLKNREYKGITLISLIVTIVVLLILAGVTINAITGNESAMEKATEAREKDKQGAELDAIKLAVVNSVASGLNGLVDANVLKNELNGLIDETSRNAITTAKTSWIVTANSGLKYKIKQNGEVALAEPVETVEFTETTISIKIGQSKALPLSIKGKSGNETEANNIEYQFSAENIAEVLDNGQIKIKDTVNPDTKVTVTIIADGVESSNSCEIIAKQGPIELGTLGSTIHGNYIDLGIDLDDNATTSDWRILYNDSTNSKIYVITDQYLNIDKIGDVNGLVKRASYSFYGTSQTNLINALEDETVWEVLVSNDIRNVYKNIKVYGALPKIDTQGNATAGTMDYIQSFRDGNYYLPSNRNEKMGYWMATAGEDNYVWRVYYKNGTAWLDCKYNHENLGCCPVAILPANILVTNSTVGTNTVWQVSTDNN